MSSTNIFKKINRNAFDEKLIHRYLFERYYFGSAKQRNKLLPKKYKKYRPNLIVPEGTKKKARYRVDLEIFFQRKRSGVPIEVKWHLSDFKKDHQKNYIKKNGGFVVVLEETKKPKIDGVSVVSIDHEDFSDWIAENISRLSRESLIYRVDSKKLSGGGHWVVFLKGGADGSAIKNFRRMLNSKPSSPFWAFRQDSKAISHILEMQKSDKIIFLFTRGGIGMAHPKNPKTKIRVFGYCIGKITTPYYMSLDEKRGLFFEDKKRLPTIGNRRWPHFVDFEIKKWVDNVDLNFGKQGGFSEAFSNSFNYGSGTPSPLSRAEFGNLKDKIFKLAKGAK